MGSIFWKITKKGNLMDYISRSCDLQKAKNGDCLYKQVMWLSKKGNLMAYISRSHDPLKMKMQSRLGCLHNQVMWLAKKGIFDGWLSIFKRHFPRNYQKRKFDGLHNQVMWPTKKQKLQGGLGAYLSRSCDLLKKEILMAYISGHVTYPR